MRTRLGLWRSCLHLDLPGALLYAVCDTGVDGSKHALGRIGCVVDREGDGVCGEVGHIPCSE